MIISLDARLNVAASLLTIGQSAPLTIPDDWRVSHVVMLLRDLGWTLLSAPTQAYPFLAWKLRRYVAGPADMARYHQAEDQARKDLLKIHVNT